MKLQDESISFFIHISLYDDVFQVDQRMNSYYQSLTNNCSEYGCSFMAKEML